MPDKPFEIKLDSVSVVIRAKIHNPAIINVDFLKNQSIVEKDWETDNSYPPLTTPEISLVSFTNGVQLDVNPQFCTFRKKVNGSFQEDYSIHNSAKKYVQTLPHIPYLAVGTNWHLFLHFQKDPVDWFKEHFFKQNGRINQIIPTNFGFKVEPNCNLTLNMQNAQSGKTIKLDCNFHTDIGNNNTQSLISAIGEYKRNQKTVHEHLKAYLEGDLS